ncbi:MAG: adenylosuccinate lyase [Candidatus Marinimicrobia bacterium]|nr:adenylosuccinate lyase [Candidatus Neomarinimicrobiota bacterium]MCF7829702.1 adenylosuccinate lyase [Candidatus Neomarinimicrobiota bacterium]MCF7881652.1 adenylosuccinate lyase [Candidatus Neomarinimicrobiota bacterium]
MIERYSTPEMEKIWSDENKYRTWLQVELAVCEVQTERGVIPESAMQTLRDKADFDIQRIEEIEAEVKHDVIAFLTSVSEFVGPDSRFVHMGMTSSDLLDTAMALQIRESGEIITEVLEEFHEVLGMQAAEYVDTVMVGRSHGIHAEPITLGLKFALWYEEIGRNLRRLEQALENLRVGKISGAVGTYQHLDMEVEQLTCERLDLEPAPVSNQIIQRDRHAELLSVLGLIGSTLDKIATEVRHLQKTETLELSEPFSKGQKGSSAMPHKKNPITCERISGMARLLRSYSQTAMENIPLWHERDISHSSVERIIFPDATTLVHYMLLKMIPLMKNIVVFPENMQRNMEATNGLLYSQEVLLKLVNSGLTREDAYKIVQDAAMDVWESEDTQFLDILKANKQITGHVSPEELEQCFTPEKVIRNARKIINRLGLGDAEV